MITSSKSCIPFKHVFLNALLLIFGCFSASLSYASCSVFEAEAEAYEGVVPKFDQNGSIRALVIYGEGTFLVGKRSLITSARREAELAARRAYSEFLNSSFDANTELSKISQEYQSTNEEGMTEGQVEELKTTLEYMANSSSSVQSGLVKLDECVDTEGKYVLVEFGWKPNLSSAAANAASAMVSPPQNNVSEVQGTVGSPELSASLGGADTKREGSIDYITVEVIGVGGSLSDATAEALRLAVSQVYGAQFASQSEVSSEIASIEATTSVGSVGASVETKQSKSSNSMQTSGVIQQWRYLGDPINSSGEVSVGVSVTMVKYVSSADPSKRTIVVSYPNWVAAENIGDVAKQTFDTALVSELQSLLNASSAVQIVERDSAAEVQKELTMIASSQNMAQMAKLGQTVGADFILIPTVEQFDSKSETRQVGEKTFDRSIFNVVVSIKVIEVATSNAYDVKRFPFKNRKLRSDTPVVAFSEEVAKTLSKHVVSKFGGELREEGTKPTNLIEARSKAQKEFEDVKSEYEDDW